MSRQFRSVSYSNLICVGAEPFTEARRCVWRRIRNQQIAHQAASFVARECNVAHQPSDNSRERDCDAWIDMRDPRLAADRARKHSHQFIKGEDLRADRVERGGLIVTRGVHGYLGQVGREDWLDAIVSSPGNSEERKPPQQPTRCC